MRATLTLIALPLALALYPLALWAAPDTSTLSPHPAASPSPPDLSALPKARYVLQGVDCFGDLRGQTCEDLLALTGLVVGAPLQLGWSGGDAVSQIQRRGPYAQAVLSPVFYADGGAWLTIDVVSPEALRRRQLRPTPTSDLPLNTDLLDLYADFEAAWLKLFQQGAPTSRLQPNRASLAPYTNAFRQEVPHTRDALIQLLHQDRTPWRRRAAAALLAYDQPDAPRTTAALGRALRDTDPTVRSEAARALLPRLAHAQDLDLDAVLHMLHLPTHADRAAACDLLSELALDPAHQRQILTAGADVLLQMLQARRPQARGKALEVLQRASNRPDLGQDAPWQDLVGL